MKRKILIIMFLSTLLFMLNGCFNKVQKEWPKEQVNNYLKIEFPPFDGNGEFTFHPNESNLLTKEFDMVINNTTFQDYQAYVRKLVYYDYVLVSEENGDGVYSKEFVKEFEDESKMEIEYDYYGFGGSLGTDTIITCTYYPTKGFYNNLNDLDLNIFKSLNIPLYEGGSSFDYQSRTEQTIKDVNQLVNYAIVAGTLGSFGLTEEERDIIKKTKENKQYINEIEYMVYAVYNTNKKEFDNYISNLTDWTELEDEYSYVKEMGNMTTILSFWHLGNYDNIEITVEKYPTAYYKIVYDVK